MGGPRGAEGVVGDGAIPIVYPLGVQSTLKLKIFSQPRKNPAGAGSSGGCVSASIFRGELAAPFLGVLGPSLPPCFLPHPFPGWPVEAPPMAVAWGLFGVGRHQAGSVGSFGHRSVHGTIKKVATCTRAGGAAGKTPHINAVFAFFKGGFWLNLPYTFF